MKNLFCALACFLGLLLTPGKSLAQNLPPFPGSYSVTIKGRQPNGVDFTRLAMYSFRADGSFRQDAWYWDSATPVGGAQAAIGTRIGYVVDPRDQYDNEDQSHSVVTLSKVLNEPPLTTFGHWTLSSDGRQVTVRFSWGDTEVWRVDRPDAALYRLELLSASYTVGPFYLQANGTRNPNVKNAGWGFGGQGQGFPYAVGPLSFQKNLVGKNLMHNAYLGDMPVRPDAMSLASVFLRTDTNIYRYVFWNAPHYVYAYLQAYPGPGMLARRVAYQIGHDYNNNGQIEDDRGHTYAGIQVIDMKGQFRGFVFSDSSLNIVGHDIAALYYLDRTLPD
jgi:hypothetical protein